MRGVSPADVFLSYEVNEEEEWRWAFFGEGHGDYDDELKKNAPSSLRVCSGSKTPPASAAVAPT